MERLVPTAVLTGVATAVVLVASVVPARAAPTSEITAATFSRLARSGHATPTDVRVVGDVVLADAIVERLRCRDCNFGGDLLARGATFGNTVDLRGSIIEGKVDLSSATFRRGLRAERARFDGIVNLGGAKIEGNLNLAEARFQSPVLLGVPPTLAGVQIDGNTDFSVATFSGLATFETAVFSGAIDFTLARFDNDAVFARASAGRDAPGAPAASASSVDTPATFARAVFHGNADFSEFNFKGPATFDGAQFVKDADFSGAFFTRRVTFEKARFGEGVTYLAAEFPAQAPPQDPEDSFWGVQADGDLSFAFAAFSRPANFQNVVATGTISFNDAAFTGARGLTFSHISAGGFEMDVGSALTAVSTDHRTDVLRLIESSAKARDDLGHANDAHYERQVILSQDYSAPVRLLDLVFYRAVAGYFVRPLHPLAVLFGVAAVFTLIRMLRSRSHELTEKTGTPAASEGGEGPAARAWTVGGRRLGGSMRAVRDFATSMLVTLTLIGPARRESQDIRQGREIEIWIYRVLFVCTLIGFANSNPTLREMFDAIR